MPETINYKGTGYTPRQISRLFFHAPAALAVVTAPDYTYKLANSLYCQFFAMSCTELIGTRFLDTFSDVQRDKIAGLCDYAIATQQTVVEQNLQLKHSGYYNLVIQPSKDPDTQITEVMIHAYDVTAQIEALQKTQESEQRFRTLITETPEVGVGLYIGKDIRIQYVNDVMLQFWKKDSSIIGKPLPEALPELEGQSFFDELNFAFSNGHTMMRKEVKAILQDDRGVLKPFYFNYTYKPLRDTDGKIYGIHHMAIDVTKEVEQNLHLAEAKPPATAASLSSGLF